MTVQEINEQVAKRLGWRKLEQADYTLDHPYYWLDRNGVQADLKDWATSIAAAWEVVENKFKINFQEDEWEFILTHQYNGWFAGWTNHCEAYIYESVDPSPSKGYLPRVFEDDMKVIGRREFVLNIFVLFLRHLKRKPRLSEIRMILRPNSIFKIR